MPARSLLLRGGLSVSYAVLIFALSSSSRPLGLEPWPLPGLDKLAHVVEFGLLALLLRWSLAAAHLRWSAVARDVLAVALAAAYGVSDELHQWLVPGRDASPWDAIADLAGALLAVVAARRLALWRDAPDAGGDHAASLPAR